MIETNRMHLHAFYNKHAFKLIGRAGSRDIFYCSCGRFGIDSWRHDECQSIILSTQGHRGYAITDLIVASGDQKMLRDWETYQQMARQGQDGLRLCFGEDYEGKTYPTVK